MNDRGHELDYEGTQRQDDGAVEITVLMLSQAFPVRRRRAAAAF